MNIEKLKQLLELVNSVETQSVVPVETQSVVPVETQSVVPVETQSVVPVETQSVVPVETQSAEPVGSAPGREYFPKGWHVLMRGRNAGVHYGEIEWLERATASCRFRWSRRIWRYAGAFTLHELTANGPQKPENCRFSCRKSNVDIVNDVCELIALDESELARLNVVPNDEE